jgi:hypothetical protein
MGDRIHEQALWSPRGAQAGERTRTAGGTVALFAGALILTITTLSGTHQWS